LDFTEIEAGVVRQEDYSDEVLGVEVNDVETVLM